ncbi:MAG: hypothetical protein KAG20_10595 [Cocleimonas sp.]|nr:hypothetical protein [Cocleimonas sp.]
MMLDNNAAIHYYSSSNSQLSERNMFSLDFGLPMLMVVGLIAFSWFSFFSVVFA